MQSEPNEEEMLTLTTIKRSKPARDLIAHLEKNFNVEQITAEKYSIRAPSMVAVGEEIGKFAKGFHKEMEYTATPKVGMTVFACIQGTTSEAFVLTNERAHLSKELAAKRRKNPPRT